MGRKSLIARSTAKLFPHEGRSSDNQAGGWKAIEGTKRKAGVLSCRYGLVHEVHLFHQVEVVGRCESPLRQGLVGWRDARVNFVQLLVVVRHLWLTLVKSDMRTGWTRRLTPRPVQEFRERRFHEPERAGSTPFTSSGPVPLCSALVPPDWLGTYGWPIVPLEAEGTDRCDHTRRMRCAASNTRCFVSDGGWRPPRAPSPEASPPRRSASARANCLRLMSVPGVGR
jgi:hypothetical protein